MTFRQHCLWRRNLGLTVALVGGTPFVLYGCGSAHDALRGFLGAGSFVLFASAIVYVLHVCRCPRCRQVLLAELAVQRGFFAEVPPARECPRCGFPLDSEPPHDEPPAA